MRWPDLTPEDAIVLHVLDAAEGGWRYTAGGLDRPRRLGIPPSEIDTVLRWFQIEMTPRLFRMLQSGERAIREAEAARIESADTGDDNPAVN